MSDTTDGTARTPSTLELLLAEGRKALAATYPDKSRDILAGRYWKIEELFTADALGEKGKCMFPHRLSEERLKEEIGDNPAAIFEGLSQSMIDFYRKKLDETKPSR